ncbi:CDP-glucose 4,6-dehydratase [Arsenicibacter rosenii]|uniref:CDP-glucose 4,6-dehydratase n=1 Tax=Arsenicibacter rosenii TaxID=1750698 RepID=A0A1S2VCA8_9BACT|nr:CDP-glucose 4,6-dehydratase [Arsenicibacter rosenii]OIN56371.1 CDP-glucose 4,6-dehydratase [Arsenicibacter rosenii]
MVNLSEKFTQLYRGKRIFLTGHTGFKGAWLMKILAMMGAEVKGYSLAPVKPLNLYELVGGDSVCESVIADIRDSARLQKELINFQPDFVFHLAAQPLVRFSYQQPLETFETNAIGTANLLNSIRLLNKPCVIVAITTDKVYSNNEWIYPYRESDRLGGFDPYSASKACAELIIDSFRNSFYNVADYATHNKAIAVARAGNVIGGGDWSVDRLIPDIVQALNSKETVHIRNPKAIRPWQHVIEPLFGYLELGYKLWTDPIKYSKAFNFGPFTSDALSVVNVVEHCIAVWGEGNYQVHSDSKHPHEAGILKLDISQALNELDWRPILTPEKAIELTIDWYKQFRCGANASDLIEADLAVYKSLL